MESKVRTVEQIVSDHIKPGMVIAHPGFGISVLPTEIINEIRRSFDETGYPNNLKLIYGGGNAICPVWGVEGLISEVMVGHYGPAKNIVELVFENKIVSWNYPQGIVGHVMRAKANGQKGYLSKIGLGTYMDPRIEGAKMNPSTTEDRVFLVEIDGEEYLYYTMPDIDVAIFRATAADEFGNAAFDDEVYTSFAMHLAMATKASGGKVILECREYVKGGSLPPRSVELFGNLVDYIVIDRNPIEGGMNNQDKIYEPAFKGLTKPVAPSLAGKPLDARLLIGRRAAMELLPHSVVNLGIGIPENVSAAASMEGCVDDVIMTLEAGVIGGEAYQGHFGEMINHSIIQDEPTQFDFFHAGLLDVAFLGMAETDKEGNVNISAFGGKPNGCGGFPDIVQPTKHIVYCATFTAGGLKEEIRDGKLVILQEGRAKKFIEKVQQISFSAATAIKNDADITYVTERAVFKLTPDGPMLIEIAPGIDLQKDILDQMDFVPKISEDLKTMDEALFRQGTFGLKQIIASKMD